MNNEEKILSLLEVQTVALKTLTAKLDKLESEVADTKSIVIKIENEHGQKLDALFDGYQLLYDVSSEIRSDIASLKVKQEKNDLQIKFFNAERHAERYMAK